MKRLVVVIVIFCAAWLDPYHDRMNEGVSRYRDGDYSGADSVFTQAYKYLPSEKERPYVAFNRGTALYRQNDYDGSIEQFNAALQGTDSDLQKRAFFNLGNAYYRQGDREKALEAWSNALAIDPGYTKAQKNIERLFMEEQEKKREKKKNGSEGENQKQKQNDESGNGGDNENQNADDDQEQSQGQDQQPEGSAADHRKGEKIEQKLSQEQIDNILQQFKARPLQRKHGDGRRGGRALEHDW
ncbi:MAG: tetratricopeptide repeat protein [Spirochaetota bacterium]